MTYTEETPRSYRDVSAIIDTSMTLEERYKVALDLRKKGYNCSQAVLLAFPDKVEMDPELVAKLTSGLGSGVGGSGELCGVICAMALGQGLCQSAAPEGKSASAKTARSLMDEFASENQGRVRCKDLKGKEGIRPCNDLVLLGVKILHEYFEKQSVL